MLTVRMPFSACGKNAAIDKLNEAEVKNKANASLVIMFYFSFHFHFCGKGLSKANGGNASPAA
jgi:hypothetical protein